MADTINVPGMGETKKTTVYIMVGGLFLISGVVYYRNKKNAAANASIAQAGSSTTDPATGYPYGSAEDAAALAAQANYNSGVGGGSYPYSTSTPGTIQTGFTSNAAWAQAYESYATQNLNADASVVAAALGKYLTGQPLTSDQLSVVEQAIAFQGIPPQSGANGYPPSYNLIPNGGTPPGSTSGGPVSATGPWNLTATVIGPTEVDLNWKSQGSYSAYQVNYGVNGNVNQYHYRVSGTSAKIGNLGPGMSWIFNVQAVSGSQLSPPSAEVTVTTPH